MFCRNSDAPIAVMSGTSRGAPRRGRYAIRSRRTATKLETYNTLGRVFGLYQTLSGLASLDAFEFLVRWPKLSDEEKRIKYSEFACHELHFFLSRNCLLYTSPSPRDTERSRMPSSA